MIGRAAVTVPVAKWLGERLAQPCVKKYLGNPKDYRLPVMLSDEERAAQQAAAIRCPI